MTRQALPVLLAVPLLAASFTAGAEPRFARLYKQQHGYPPSCDACHKDGGGTALNAYGEAFKEAGGALAAFGRIAGQDSDGDGFSNAQETAAQANPGSRRSTPEAPGDWLSTANRIPRAVQKLFPGVTAYKPLDAILTDKEIARARALGVELAEEDETTIYIPVADGKAAGTAIIVPARFRDETFFVVLATDRQLQVTHAGAMHAGAVEGAAEPALYREAIGLAVDALPGGNTASLQGAVSAALKKAGTLLFVRLKG